MNWNDPNWIGAWGQWASAICSLLAVSTAVWIAICSSSQAQKQSQQNRYDSARPALVVSSHHNGKLFALQIQPDLPGWLDWNASKQGVWVKNAGTGTAFNIMSVLYGPESVVKDNQSIDTSSHEHWTYMMSNLGVNEEDLCVYNRGGSMFFEGCKEIGGYPFLAPAQPLHNPGYHEPIYICRVTITYHDIFKHKHASIFDRDLNGNWIMRAVLEDISYDLHDLEGLKKPVSRPQFLKHIKKRIPRL